MYILSSSTGSTLSSCLQVSQFCVPQYSRQVLLLWGRVLAAPRQLGRAYRAQQLRAAVKTCMYVAADDFSRKYKNNRYIDIYFHFQKDYITNCFTLYVILRCLELSLFICLFNIRNQTIPPRFKWSDPHMSLLKSLFVCFCSFACLNGYEYQTIPPGMPGTTKHTGKQVHSAIASKFSQSCASSVQQAGFLSLRPRRAGAWAARPGVQSSVVESSSKSMYVCSCWLFFKGVWKQHVNHQIWISNSCTTT